MQKYNLVSTEYFVDVKETGYLDLSEDIIVSNLMSTLSPAIESTDDPLGMTEGMKIIFTRMARNFLKSATRVHVWDTCSISYAPEDDIEISATYSYNSEKKCFEYNGVVRFYTREESSENDTERLNHEKN